MSKTATVSTHKYAKVQLRLSETLLEDLDDCVTFLNESRQRYGYNRSDLIREAVLAFMQTHTRPQRVSSTRSTVQSPLIGEPELEELLPAEFPNRDVYLAGMRALEVPVRQQLRREALERRKQQSATPQPPWPTRAQVATKGALQNQVDFEIEE